MRAIIKYLPPKQVISQKTYSYAGIIGLILIFLTIGKSACTKISEVDKKPSPLDPNYTHGANSFHR